MGQEAQMQNLERTSSEKAHDIDKYKMDTKEGECL